MIPMHYSKYTLLHVAARNKLLEDVNAASPVFHVQDVASATGMKVQPSFEKFINISFRLNILDAFLKIVKK